jgi:formiminoglutamase
MTPYFHAYKKDDLDLFIRPRAGETKLGEVIPVPGEVPLKTFLETTPASFVVIGVAEDIGVLANCGNPGTDTAWRLFLRAFLNIQSNEFTMAHTIAVIGHLSFDALKLKIEKMPVTPEIKIDEYRNAVTIIDNAVEELIQVIVSHRKIPIIVGGGHNNCYPIIKGTATALASTNAARIKGINCVNLDAHIDYRIAEGRHSGNGFRYAKQEGFLRKYFALGIHENYIHQDVLKEMHASEDIAFITYEEIFIQQLKSWAKALEAAAAFMENSPTGIELDLDSIEYLPSSAATPCGVTTREALQYINYMASQSKVTYLHICEGIASKEDALVGKLISYAVTTFIKTITSGIR